MPRTVVRESKGSRATPLLVEPYCWHKLRRARLGLGVSSTTMLRDEAWHYLYLDLVQKMKREDLQRLRKLITETSVEEVLRTYDGIVGYLLLNYIARKNHVIREAQSKASAVLDSLAHTGYLEDLVDRSLLPELYFACSINGVDTCINRLKNLGMPLADLYLVLFYAINKDLGNVLQTLKAVLTNDRVYNFISRSVEGASLFLIALSKAGRKVMDLARESEDLAEKLLTYIERSIKTVEEYVEIALTLTGPKIEQHMFYKIRLALELSGISKCVIAPKPIRKELRRIILDSIKGYKPIPEELYRKTIDTLRWYAFIMKLRKEILLNIVIPMVIPVLSVVVGRYLTFISPENFFTAIAYLIILYFVVTDIAKAKKAQEVLQQLEGQK